MAYKKEIKPWLAENGYTWEDMDKFWKDACEVNYKCQLLKKVGKSWNDMNMFAIQQLPSLKEETLKRIQQNEEEERMKAEEEQKKKDAEKYYWDHFDEIMVKKIDDGESLTEKELKCAVFETNEIDREYGENRRWSRGVSSIVEMCGRYFCIVWDEGLTECQENEFYDQPYEVEKCTYEKTITVTEWKKKK